MNTDTLGLIAEFVNDPIYKLRLWIDENKINWISLSGIILRKLNKIKIK